MTNKHTRLKQLEKLAAEKRVLARKTFKTKLSAELEKEFSEMTTEEIINRYRAGSDEPLHPELEGKSTVELIDLYQRECQRP